MPSFHRPNRALATALTTLLVVCLLVVPGRPLEAGENGALWTALREGTAFAIMRHALAPGTGDPGNFAADDCATQRNLSDQGRRQAAEIGDRFRQQGIERAEVLSSAWCRCQETAELLRLGPVETLSPLNSFFANPERRAPQTAALEDWLADRRFGEPLVLVTHQVNITALTGVYPRSGEIVVARREADGTIAVLGRL